MKSICFIYLSNFENASRIERFAKFYSKRLNARNIYCIGKSTIANTHIRKNFYLDIPVILLNFSDKLPKPISLLIWSLSAFRNLSKIKPNIISCESVSVAPLCLIYSFFYKCEIIYSPHEYECFTSEYNNKLKRNFALIIERLIILKAKCIITVSKAISLKYLKRFPNKSFCHILNIPETVDKKKYLTPTKNLVSFEKKISKLRKNSENFIFLYSGMLDKSRKVDLIAKTFTKLPKFFNIIFLGFGDLEQSLISLSKTHSNIFICGPVKSNEINKATSQVDCGFSFLEKNCLNHELALPNKLLSCLQSGIPVISNGRKQIAQLIKKYNAGIIIDDSSELLFQKSLLTITQDDIARFKFGARKFQQKNSWEKEERKLIKFLKKTELNL